MEYNFLNKRINTSCRNLTLNSPTADIIFMTRFSDYCDLWSESRGSTTEGRGGGDHLRREPRSGDPPPGWHEVHPPDADRLPGAAEQARGRAASHLHQRWGLGRA